MPDPSPPHPPATAEDKDSDPREMYSEIAALIAALAKSFALKDSAAAAAVEAGTMALEFARDANGNRFVAATYGGKTARVYQGAIKHDDRAE